MTDFISLFRRRFLQKEILLAILLSVVIMAVSYAVRASPEIQAYWQLRSGNHFAIQQLPGILTNDAAMRVYDDYVTVAASQAFSFYILMSNGFMLYYLLANIFIVLPVIRFFNERKDGVLQLIAVRYGTWSYIAREAFVASLVGMLLVLLPSIVFWALALLFSPAMFPLSQTFGPFADDFFQHLGKSENIAVLYLVLILLNGILFFSRTMLAFSFSLILERKAILLFVPLIFTYFLYILFSIIGIPEYASLSYSEEHIKSLAPILLSTILPLFTSVIVFYGFCNKERIFHA